MIAFGLVSETQLDDVGRRGFWAAISLLTGLLIASAFVVASAAFFADDDFRWLSTVRDPGFSLLGAWLPLEHREWWSYRPLGMHTHFYVSQALFGLTPMAFYSIALGVHFAGGVLVLVFARQLGLPTPLAATAALLAISRPPSMDVIFWASAFSYFAVAAMSMLGLVLFWASLQRDAAGLRWASVFSMFLALACQESAVLLPVVMYALAWLHGVIGDAAPDGAFGQTRRSPLHRVLSPLRSTWPHVGLAAGYLIWRFGVIAPFERSFNYQSVWGWNTMRNASEYMGWVAGSEGALALLLGALIAAPLVVWRSASGTRAQGVRLFAVDAFCLVWILATLLPFVPVRMIAARFAIALEIPLCVLFAVQLAALWRCAGARGRLGLQAGTIVVLVLSMPVATLRAAWESPRGSLARGVFDTIQSELPTLPDKARIVWLYGGPGQLADAWKVRREAWSGTPLIRTLAPGRGQELSFQHIDKTAPAADFEPNAQYYAMRADGTIERASATVQEHFFLAGLSSHKPGAPGAAAQRLALLLGAGAIDPIVAEARARGRLGQEAIAQSLLLIQDPRAETAAVELIPSASRRSALRRRLEQQWILGNEST